MGEWVRLEDIEKIVRRIDKHTVLDYTMVDIDELESAVDHLESYDTEDIIG